VKFWGENIAMSVLDLSVRLTDDEQRFADFGNSSDSLILIRRPPKSDGSLVKPDDLSVMSEGPSVLLSVGEYWYDCERERDFAIDKDGFQLHPNTSVVIETLEEVALPQNVFGLLTGKGLHIFRGILISPGKIDPTFHDRLRIGVFNGGRNDVLLKTGDPLCCCCFFLMESEITKAMPRTSFGPRVLGTRVPLSIRWARRLRDPVAIAVLTALNALGVIASAIFAYLAIHHH
jgi:deoxycytidine triphosphate deaminase